MTVISMVSNLETAAGILVSIHNPGARGSVLC
jgi:hypothetical protein